MNENKNYINDCFKLIDNNYQGSELCVGYCASCGAPLSAEGTQICPKCQKQIPPDDYEHLLTINKAGKN